MILVGQYDSPFVRRVAVTMNVYDMAFERRVLSVFTDFDAMLTINPLGKVPVLQIDDGERLYDSRAILDFLDGLVRLDQRMVPADELLDAVWRDTFVTPNVLTRVVAQLRKAIGDEAHESRYIETVARRGYRFVASIQVLMRERPFGPVTHVVDRGVILIRGGAPVQLPGRQERTALPASA